MDSMVADNMDISTHSLTKRLTYDQSKHYHGEKHFNSQPHEEADSWRTILSFHLWYFNSQPHEEADVLRRVGAVGFYISTHSLTKRLTTSACSLRH